MTHPLTNNPQWLFWQPYIGARATVLVLQGDDNAEIHALSSLSTCREVIVTNIRQGLRNLVMVPKVPQGQPSWNKVWRRQSRIRLYDPRLLEGLKGANGLRVHKNGLKSAPSKDPAPERDRVQEFLQVCDAICGLPSVLLSHYRPEGEWWRSPEEHPGEHVHWSGTDNWFMRHPALLGLATGLVRQAALLVAYGFGPQVLEGVERNRVEEALTSADWRLAYELVLKLRPWIEVPVGTGGAQRNYPVPMGFWNRFDCLQRAQRRHNYREVFGTGFYDSWALPKQPEKNGGQQWSGAFSFWGERGNYTEAHRRLMNLGKPNRRSRGGKVSSGDS